MGESKKQIRVKGRIMAIYVVMAVALILLCWLRSNIESPDTKFNDFDMVELTEDWTVEYEGGTMVSTLPAKLDQKVMTPVKYSIRLKNNYGVFVNSLMIRSVHQYYKIYLDGILLSEYGYENKTPFGDRPYSAWVIVRLPDGFQGKMLTIEETRFYKNQSGTLSHVYLGSKNSMVLNRVDSSLLFLVLDTCILLGSLVMILVSFLYRKKEPVIQLRYLGLFAFFTGLWMMLESASYQIFSGNGPFVSNLIFVLFSLIPITAAGFILTYESFCEDRCMRILYWLAVLNFAVVHLLQLTGVCDYIQSMIGAHVVLIGIGLDILWKAIKICQKKGSLTDKPLFVSCLILAAFAGLDILKFYMGKPDENASYFTQFGLFLFFLTLLYFGIQKIFEDYEFGVRKEMLEQMAYTDVMTGLPNRNAYEQRLDRLRGGRREKLVIAVADLNGLKIINDQSGHRKGDEALNAVASVLADLCRNKADVYRVGGDEFCVISEKMNIEDLEIVFEKAKDRLQEESRQRGINISLAAGFCSQETGNVDEILKKADVLMYNRKKRMKAGSDEK